MPDSESAMRWVDIDEVAGWESLPRPWFVVVFDPADRCHPQGWQCDDYEGEPTWGCTDEGGYSGSEPEVLEGLAYELSQGFAELDLHPLGVWVGTGPFPTKWYDLEAPS